MTNELSPLAQLGKAFGYSVDDLKNNRVGRLSRRQRRQVWGRFSLTLIGWLLLLLFPIGVGLALVLWDGQTSFSDALFHPATSAGYLVGGLLALFYGVVQFSTLMLVVDVLRGRVHAISGPVERYGRYLYVKRSRFLLEQHKLDLIQSGLRYTFYILPGSRQVLSIEFAE